MNQILQTRLKSGRKKFFLKFQLFISIVVFLLLIVYLFLYWQNLHRDELYSDSLLSNYNLTRLYANSESSNTLYSNDFFSILDANSSNNPILGIIEIKAIDVYYPFFAYYSDDNLKISLCRFFGPEPGRIGNVCILGHNYNNDKFFSNVNSLKVNDEIVLYDNLQNSFHYFVEKVYEVNNSDFSPIYDYDKNGKFLTLITCNNVNNNRIIVRACAK